MYTTTGDALDNTCNNNVYGYLDTQVMASM